MRVFYAIEFKEEIKDSLFSVQKDLRRLCNGGNFSHRENFHLTLRFIGEQTPEQVQKLISALHNTAAVTSGFTLKINRLGAFNKGNKKIIWAGLEKNIELQLLYNELENNLDKAGYPREERGYSPHITLVRETRLENSAEGLNNIKFNNIHIQVDSISLMESKRVDNRLTYTAIARVALL